MGGKIDTVIRGLVDTLLTVPGLVVLVSIASTIREEISVNIMALVVASLAWMWPTRTIRSQVLTMRERAYVQMAKLNGMSNGEIIWKELFPNLLPYLAANFTNAVNWAILSSIGLGGARLGAAERSNGRHDHLLGHHVQLRSFAACGGGGRFQSSLSA